MNSLADRLRAQVIDSCLQNRQRKWCWEDLARACGQKARQQRPSAQDPKRSTILKTIQLMRSGELGYEAPIVVSENKYYAYAKADFQIQQPMLSDTEVARLQEALQLFKDFPQWPLVPELNSLATRLSSLREAEELLAKGPSFVLFDQLRDSPGQQWLQPLYQHIRQEERIKMAYHPFTEPDPLHKIVSPYLLKAYNKRWFMLGYDHTDARIHTFALDRIVSIQTSLPHTFWRDPRFHADYWFRHLYGVSMPYDAKPEEIRISSSKQRAKYLETKPLHHSQEVTSRNEDSVHFKFYLIINFEWTQLLLSYGADIRVLAPTSLADAIREQHYRAWQNYT